jgi:chlorobactene glucosyltransferase
VNEFSLFIFLIAINALWGYLYVAALNSHFHTPVIQSRRARRTLKHIRGKHKRDPTNTMNDNHSFPFVSVIIPARNEENYIQRCLLSLLCQNYPNFEIIAVDDNSADSTLRMMKEIEKKSEEKNILKVISLTNKPKGWTGKTWASEQGYLRSRGNLLLFTDADSHFFCKDTISLAISFMWKEKLDVLTGVPHIELRDFWSKITVPLWFLFTEIFRTGIADVNNPKSNVAYVMGSFFIIKRTVFEEVGTFRTVCDAIQEDRAIGISIKKAGYKMRIVKIDELVSALLSRDRLSLWQYIRRHLTAVALESKWRPLINFLTLTFMTILPFMTLPYVVIIATQDSQFLSLSQPSIYAPDSFLLSLSLFLNILTCLLIILGAAIKDIKKHKLTPAYSLLAFPGAIFLVIAYLANIVTLLKPNQQRYITWRGRKYLQTREGVRP